MVERRTMKKALRKTIQLWEWLADHPHCGKREWPEWEEEVENDCFLCGYAASLVDHDCYHCRACPVDWGNYRHCYDDGAPYDRWSNPDSDEDKVQAARDLVNLCKAKLRRIE